MTFEQIQEILAGSSLDEWKVNECENIFKWEINEASVSNPLKPITHSSIAVYKPDVDITLVWGAKIDDFQESWTLLFPDPNAYTIAIELRYRGVVIDSLVGIRVDGSRYLLPYPESDGKGGYQINKNKLQGIPELLFQLDSPGIYKTLEEAFTLADVRIINNK